MLGIWCVGCGVGFGDVEGWCVSWGDVFGGVFVVGWDGMVWWVCGILLLKRRLVFGGIGFDLVGGVLFFFFLLGLL